VAEVNYTVYSSGSFVNSINNVNNAGFKAWIWWRLIQQFGWDQGKVACDKYLIGDNETAYWYYQDTSTFPNLQAPQ
jgi:hypothetical protein